MLSGSREELHVKIEIKKKKMKPKEIVDKPQNVLKDNKYFIHHVTIVYFLSFIGFRNNLK